MKQHTTIAKKIINCTATSCHSGVCIVVCTTFDFWGIVYCFLIFFYPNNYCDVKINKTGLGLMVSAYIVDVNDNYAILTEYLRKRCS